MEFLAAFIVFATVVALMAVGVMFKRSPIQGSCGGISSFSGGKCDFCGGASVDACDTKLLRQAK